MQIYDTTAETIRHAAATAGVKMPAAPLTARGRRVYYTLNLKSGIPAFLGALFALAPAAEVRTARGRYKGRSEWLAHRAEEAEARVNELALAGARR